MNDTEQLLAYLTRHYRYHENNFYDIENDRVTYGVTIVKNLNTVFSINEDVCSVVLVTWAQNLGVTTELIEAAWVRPNLLRGVTYESKRENRFLVTFPNHFNLQLWTIKTASRPSMYFEVNKFLDIQYSKKMKWRPMTFVLNDPIEPSTSQSLTTVIREHLTTPFKITIEMLDPTGVVVEKWDINNCVIDSIDFGSLDISSDKLASCSITVNVGDVNQLF